MKKIILFLLIISQTSTLLPTISKICSPIEMCSPVNKEEKNKEEEIIRNFKPDILVTEKTSPDLELYKIIKDLFFEPDPKVSTNPFAENSREKVCNKCVKKYGAQKIFLTTDDECKISALYFKRENAPLNIIYATGYFDDQTPTKEWPAPFALLFPNLNILSFDWRGFGDSKVEDPKTKLNKFGTNAYPDIQAVIDFISKENNKPIVLVGFCAGSAMVLHATEQAEKTNKKTADALVLNSIFTKFENQVARASVSENRLLKRLYMKFVTFTGLSKHILNRKLNGNLYSLKPIEIIEETNIPCYFEHYTKDPSAIIQEGILVYEKAKSPKMFFQSDLGKHVRIHTFVPNQYRQAFYLFLTKIKLLDNNQIESLILADLEHDQKILNKIDAKSCNK